MLLQVLIDNLGCWVLYCGLQCVSCCLKERGMEAQVATEKQSNEERQQLEASKVRVDFHMLSHVKKSCHQNSHDFLGCRISWR